MQKLWDVMQKLWDIHKKANPQHHLLLMVRLLRLF